MVKINEMSLASVYSKQQCMTPRLVPPKAYILYTHATAFMPAGYELNGMLRDEGTLAPQVPVWVEKHSKRRGASGMS